MVRAFVFAAAMDAASIPAQAQTCTRDGLKAIVANYFNSFETHNMSALATAPNLRITENGQEVEAGEGFFKTGGKAQLQRSLIDAERCGTLTEAVVDETVDGATAPNIMAVRLKITGGKVSEIETLVTRKGGTMNFYDPQALLATKDQSTTVPCALLLRWHQSLQLFFPVEHDVDAGGRLARRS